MNLCILILPEKFPHRIRIQLEIQTWMNQSISHREPLEVAVFFEVQPFEMPVPRVFVKGESSVETAKVRPLKISAQSLLVAILGLMLWSKSNHRISSFRSTDRVPIILGTRHRQGTPLKVPGV